MIPGGSNLGCENSRGVRVRAEKMVEGYAGGGIQLAGVRKQRSPDESFDLLASVYLSEMLPEDQRVEARGERALVAKPGLRPFAVDMTSGPHWDNRSWSWLSSVSPENDWRLPFSRPLPSADAIHVEGPRSGVPHPGDILLGSGGCYQAPRDTAIAPQNRPSWPQGYPLGTGGWRRVQ